MEYQKYFEIVEKVLQNYPIEYSRNYYENKESIQVNKKEQQYSAIGGAYDNDQNIIDIYLDRSLPHELFHMSFRDKSKVGKKIYEEEDIYYGNGVSFTKKQGDRKIIYNKGLTEGFAEYLTRKSLNNNHGQQLNCFFTDLLISIHGEDILKYPLLNDPVGLFLDERFYDIVKISHNLDLLDNCQGNIIIISNLRDTIESIFKIADKEIIKEQKEFFELIMRQTKISVINLFKAITKEYKKCNNPNISREEFIEKLETFLIEPCYSVVFKFDDFEFSAKKEIEKLINKEKNISFKIKKKIKRN